MSIGTKLFFGLFSSMVVVFLGFSRVTSMATGDAWRSSFDDQATQTTAVIERLLRQQMLQRNKDAVHAALKDVASAPGIQSVRIYDKKGVIRFSTRPEERGTRATKEDEICVICHGDHFRTSRDESISRVLHSKEGAIMAQARVIKNGTECAGGECHASPEEKSYLGVLDFQTSMAVVEQADVRAEHGAAYAALAMALVGGLATFFMIWQLVRRPVLDVVVGLRAVARGELDTRLRIDQSTEFHEIAYAFNQMTSDLAVAEERSRLWEKTLADAIEAKTNELAATHRRMMHMEKMASLGKLAAMVAHEINNPLAGILVYAKLVLRDLGGGTFTDDDRREASRYLEVIRQESERCGEIVKNLLSFARKSNAVFKEQSLAVIIQRAVMTVQHLMKTNSVSCAPEDIQTDDRIFCDENDIQQALVALLVNAVEAMPTGGEIRIAVKAKGEDHVTLSVSDTGVGIAPEAQVEIFEPFFSTKGEEKGVGLGLAAVYGIVRRHQGVIEVESDVGKGATFVLTLPRKPQPAKNAESDRSDRPTEESQKGETP